MASVVRIRRPRAHDRLPHRVGPRHDRLRSGYRHIAPPCEFANDLQSLATVQIIDLVAPKATLIPDTPPAGQNGWSRNQSNRPTPNVVVATRLRTSRVVPSLSLAVDQLRIAVDLRCWVICLVRAVGRIACRLGCPARSRVPCRRWCGLGQPICWGRAARRAHAVASSWARASGGRRAGWRGGRYGRGGQPCLVVGSAVSSARDRVLTVKEQGAGEGEQVDALELEHIRRVGCCISAGLGLKDCSTAKEHSQERGRAPE